jgi:hypothetical protein
VTVTTSSTKCRPTASKRGLAVATVVRAVVLQAIVPVDDLKSALEKLETDLAALRRKALSA